MLGEEHAAPVVDGVVGVDERTGSGVVVGPHQGRGIGRWLERLGDDERDRLADEAHAVGGDRRPDEVGVHRDEAVVRRHAEVVAP